jgi:hypothetical protein
MKKLFQIYVKDPLSIYISTYICEFLIIRNKIIKFLKIIFTACFWITLFHIKKIVYPSYPIRIEKIQGDI